MLCGEFGHKTVFGEPCKQVVNVNAKGCCWHTRTPSQRRSLAALGRATQRMKRALRPEDLTFTFADEDAVIAFAENMAKRALTEDVDQQRIKTALQSGSLALAGFAAKTTARMVAALESLEHGGAALLLMSQLTDKIGTGTKRPLPSRVLQLARDDGAGPDPAS